MYLRRLHRLSGCLRTDPSVMAGGWAVSGVGRFSRGWLPAPSGRSHRPGIFGDSSPALTAEALCRRGMYGRRRGGRLGGCRPGRILGCDHEGGPIMVVNASSAGKPLPGGAVPSSRECSAGRDRLVGLRDRRARMCGGGRWSVSRRPRDSAVSALRSPVPRRPRVLGRGQRRCPGRRGHPSCRTAAWPARRSRLRVGPRCSRSAGRWALDPATG